MITGYTCDWCQKPMSDFEALGNTTFGAEIPRSGAGDVYLSISATGPTDRNAHLHDACMTQAIKAAISVKP